MSTPNENNEAIESTQVEETTVEPAAEPTFTKSQVDSQIASAVNAALKRAKEKASKTSDERITALEAELAKRDNMEYARGKAKEFGIPSDICSLFFSESNDVTDARIDTFSTWYKDAIDKAVTERLKEAKPIELAPTNIDPKPNRPRSLADIQNARNKH